MRTAMTTVIGATMPQMPQQAAQIRRGRWTVAGRSLDMV